MADFQQQLADEMERVFKARAWSLMKAQIATGVNRSVIHQMKSGLPPSPQKVVDWADGIKEDRGLWLRAAGYEFVDSLAVQEPPPPTPAPVEERPDWLQRYDGQPADVKHILDEQFRQIINTVEQIRKMMPEE